MIISANEAKSQSRKSISEEINNELIRVERDIKNACQNGNLSCAYYGVLHKLTVEHLSSLGYSLKPVSRIDDTFQACEIMWS